MDKLIANVRHMTSSWSAADCLHKWKGVGQFNDSRHFPDDETRYQNYNINQF